MRSPNRWSCTPTAAAMAISCPLPQLLSIIGHDGSEIIYPNKPEPFCRRSFHIQEIIYALWTLGFGVVQFQAIPVTNFGRVIAYDFEKMLDHTCSIICGIGHSGVPHTVMWDGRLIHDPNGTRYEIDKFQIETLYCIFKIKSN